MNDGRLSLLVIPRRFRDICAVSTTHLIWDRYDVAKAEMAAVQATEAGPRIARYRRIARSLETDERRSSCCSTFPSWHLICYPSEGRHICRLGPDDRDPCPIRKRVGHVVRLGSPPGTFHTDENVPIEIGVAHRVNGIAPAATAASFLYWHGGLPISRRVAAFPDLLAQFVQFKQPGFEVNCRVGDECKGIG
jgi:hypothetical protein